MNSATNSAAFSRIVANASRTGHGAHTAAHAFALLGGRAVACCCWCIEADEALDDATTVRLPAGGECDRCAYVGRDCLLVEIAA